MQDRKIVLIALLTALIIFSTTGTSFVFIHSDGLEDGDFEIFGPRIDRILIKMYGTLAAEIAALQAGEIDITDWALTKPMIDTLSTDPNIRVSSYGGEAGYYTFSLNLNNNSYLGNPPNPLYPNPVYPNPMSELALRQACAYLTDRITACNGPGLGLYEPIYTPIPAYMEYWIHSDIKPETALENLTYPYNIARAAEVLDNGGFPMGPDGYRYWDRNRNGVKDSGESFQLKFYSRADALRRGISDILQAGFNDTMIKIPHIRQEITSGQCFLETAARTNGWEGINCGGGTIAMTEKNYHIYTSGWIFIGPDPDYLYDLYHFDNYWHPSNPPNFGSVSIDDPIMQAQLEAIKNAPSQTEAVQACMAFQEGFAATVSEIPIASISAPKAFSKWYTGGNDGIAITPDDGENAYRGQVWTNLVNQAGSGENSWWSTLNMYPEGHPFGDGTMTVRYGWEQTSFPAIVNPIYSSWYWENEINSRVYDTLGSRNPYTLGPVEVPQLAENWTLGTWIDPNDGLTKSAVTITVRPDVLWNDDVPLTIDDIIYTFMEVPGELEARGCSPPWWEPTVDQIAGFYKLDQYSATILMKTRTYLAQTWVVGNIVIPKHFWQPFIAAHTAAEIMGDLGTGQIGTGPFLYTNIVPGSSATLLRNPDYYLASPVDPITEGNPVGVQFLAVAPSTQLSPTKISDSGNGTGTARIIVLLQNHGKTASSEATFTVTLTKLAGSGTNQTLTSSTTITIINATRAIAFDGTKTLEKGKYSIEVLVDATYQGKSFHHEYHKIVYVTVQGDISEDGAVDITDIVIVAGHFGTSIGETGYDPVSDVNRDGVVDILDIVKVAGNFGWNH